MHPTVHVLLLSCIYKHENESVWLRKFRYFRAPLLVEWWIIFFPCYWRPGSVSALTPNQFPLTLLPPTQLWSWPETSRVWGTDCDRHLYPLYRQRGRTQHFKVLLCFHQIMNYSPRTRLVMPNCHSGGCHWYLFLEDGRDFVFSSVVGLQLSNSSGREPVFTFSWLRAQCKPSCDEGVCMHTLNCRISLIFQLNTCFLVY